jgi:hypothetical protein
MPQMKMITSKMRCKVIAVAVVSIAVAAILLAWRSRPLTDAEAAFLGEWELWTGDYDWNIRFLFEGDRTVKERHLKINGNGYEGLNRCVWRVKGDILYLKYKWGLADDAGWLIDSATRTTSGKQNVGDMVDDVAHVASVRRDNVDTPHRIVSISEERIVLSYGERNISLIRVVPDRDASETADLPATEETRIKHGFTELD